MKIAVASDENNVCGHFGHCKNFNIFDTDGSNITSINCIPNPGHKPGFLPNFLADMNVEVVIAGSMGGHAADIFNKRNVKTIIGAAGKATEAALLYLRGELKSSGALCHEHSHSSECGGHK